MPRLTHFDVTMDAFIDKYLPWFTLRGVPAVGGMVFKRLIDRFSTPEAVLNATPLELRSVEGIGTKIIAGIQQRHKFEEQARKELARLFRARARIVTFNDPDYPELLGKIPDPPPVLTFRGTLSPQSPCLAIVGSRKATTYGLSSARKLSAVLAERGFTIVSGLARGIDAAAHQGALDVDGRTIAVLGSGLNQVYPPENRQLCTRIIESGAVISEFEINSWPQPIYFPVRNRIIAGMSVGILVVEAARKSGSLITARLAGEFGREVFAVPGSIRSGNSAGTHWMLKQGAILVENEMDIIDELGHLVHPAPPNENREQSSARPHATVKNPAEKTILAVLGPYPVHIDTIIARSRLDTGSVNTALLELELNGTIERSQGNYFTISEEKID